MSETRVAVDPSELAPGDDIIVEDVDGDEPLAEGEVVETSVEWGRYSVTVELDERDDELDLDRVEVQDYKGRTWTKIV